MLARGRGRHEARPPLLASFKPGLALALELLVLGAGDLGGVPLRTAAQAGRVGKLRAEPPVTAIGCGLSGALPAGAACFVALTWLIA